MTFKSDLLGICAEVAQEFDGWEFQSSAEVFKNKVLQHTDQVVGPYFVFKDGICCKLNPMAEIYNKKVGKLFKRFTGMDRQTLGIHFQLESADYRGPSSVGTIFQEEFAFKNARGEPEPWPKSFLVLAQAKDYLRKLLADGIGFLHAHFDLTTEENLLKHLPTSYKWMDKGIGNTGVQGSFYENDDGIMLCLAAIVLGNFEFVERYASADFKTLYPKNESALQRIVEALPEFKRHFEETGRAV